MRTRIIISTFIIVFLLAQSVPVQGSASKDADQTLGEAITGAILPLHTGDAPGKIVPSTFLYFPLVMKPYVYPPTCATAPTLISPSDGSYTNNLIPFFQWDSGNNPNATTLHVGIWQDPGLTDWVDNVSTENAQGVNQFLIYKNLNPSTTYYWRAYLMCGTVHGPFSQTWSFTTGSGGTFLPRPTLISPVDLSILSGTTAYLQWSPVVDAVEYQFEYVGGTKDRGDFISSTQVTLDSLDPDTIYGWSVRARNDYAWGSMSNFWQFTTGGSGSMPVTSSMPFPQEFVQMGSMSKLIIFEKFAGK